MPAGWGLILTTVAAALGVVAGVTGLLLTAGRRRPLVTLGALALGAFTLAATFLANRYWALPPGPERFMMANAFYEHLGLAGAFLLVVLWDRRHEA